MTPEKSTRTNPIPGTLIAPCGMNCRLCQAYARDKALPWLLRRRQCQIKNLRHLSNQEL